MTYSMDKRTLAVLAWVAKDDDGREHLQALRLVDGVQMATNGHGLACLLIEDDTEKWRASVDVTLRSGRLRKALRQLGRRRKAYLRPHEIGRLALECDDGKTVVIEAADEEWVEWRHDYIVQQTEPRARVGIAAEYLRQVADSAKAIGATTVKLELWDAEKPLRWIAYGPDGEELVIILMPRRL